MRQPNILDLAIDFSLAANRIKIRGHLKEELDRAASSVTIELAESNLKGSRRDKLVIFDSALNHLRECQEIFGLIELEDPKLLAQTEVLIGQLMHLIDPPAKVSLS